MQVTPALMFWSLTIAYMVLGAVIMLSAKMLQEAMQHLEETLRPTLENLSQMKRTLDYLERLHRLEHSDFDVEDDETA